MARHPRKVATNSPVHPLKVTATAAAVDDTLSSEQGWLDLKVRWLVTRETHGADRTVVGYSVFPPGAMHDLHRHPNAEEWEFVLQGRGVKRVGDDDIQLEAGDLVFTPADTIHGVVNTSSAETLVTIWGYCGAGSLDEAGYVVVGDDPDHSSRRAWPAHH